MYVTKCKRGSPRRPTSWRNILQNLDGASFWVTLERPSINITTDCSTTKASLWAELKSTSNRVNFPPNPNTFHRGKKMKGIRNSS